MARQAPPAPVVRTCREHPTCRTYRAIMCS